MEKKELAARLRTNLTEYLKMMLQRFSEIPPQHFRKTWPLLALYEKSPSWRTAKTKRTHEKRLNKCRKNCSLRSLKSATTKPASNLRGTQITLLVMDDPLCPSQLSTEEQKKVLSFWMQLTGLKPFP